MSGSWGLIALALIVGFYWYGKRLETEHFPVTREVHVEIYQEQFPRLLLKGGFKKVRDCDFRDLRWYLGRRGDRASSVVLEYHKTKVRTVGREEFDDWYVTLERHQLANSYANVWHQCYFFRFEWGIGSDGKPMVWSLPHPTWTRTKFYN